MNINNEKLSDLIDTMRSAGAATLLGEVQYGGTEYLLLITDQNTKQVKTVVQELLDLEGKPEQQ